MHSRVTQTRPMDVSMGSIAAENRLKTSVYLNDKHSNRFDVFALDACMSVGHIFHGAGPARIILYLGNAPNEMLMFVVHFRHIH